MGSPREKNEYEYRTSAAAMGVRGEGRCEAASHARTMDLGCLQAHTFLALRRTSSDRMEACRRNQDSQNQLLQQEQ